MKSAQDKTTLYVDLDGTLIRSDLFALSIIRFVFMSPLNILLLMKWLWRGRAKAKHLVAEAIELDIENLPYEKELLSYVKAAKDRGQRVVLATASAQKYAKAVAHHLGTFDDVLATSDNVNLKGKNKLLAIQNHAGDGRFDYAGDSRADRPIWDAAETAIYVNASEREVKRARLSQKNIKVMRSQPNLLKSFIIQMRWHQYSKNALIFVPLFTSHMYNHPSSLGLSLIAFLCFSLIASSGYFFNDLLDLQSDRRHPTKRKRPLASGDLSLKTGIAGGLCLFLASITIAVSSLPIPFLITLIFYFALTTIYSAFLKSISTADVLALAILYTTRIFAGAAAIGVEVSAWLMAFSIFIFVSLAYLKRYIELTHNPDRSARLPGRGYQFDDHDSMFTLGIANMTASVVVLALYVNSEEVICCYNSPNVLWILCLMMLYWGNRIWIGAKRGKISEDPVVFAIKDSISRYIAVAFVVVVMIARHLKI